MRLRTYEEWGILVVFAAISVVFYMNTDAGQKYDLIFIYPLLLFIGVLCAVVGVGAVRSGRRPARGEVEHDRAAARPDDGVETTDGAAPPQTLILPSPPGRRALALAVLMVILLFAIEYVGLLTSLFLFLVAAMWSLGVRDLRTLSLMPIVLIGLIYLTFVELLGTPIDVSSIGLY